MMTRTIATGVVAALLSLALASGCVKRTERITVGADGRVAMNVEIEGKPNEIDGVDAVPTKEGGWSVQREVKTEEHDGKQEETLKIVAEQSFDPGAELPRTYAAPGDADAELFLDFPTKVWFEKRKDGTYVHFKRTYSPRAWAFVQYWESHFFDEDIKKIAQKPVDELSLDERIQVLKAFGYAEAHKQLELAEAALKRIDPDLAPDLWLQARAALLDSFHHVDWETLANFHTQAKKDHGDQFLEDSMLWVHPEDAMTQRVAEDKRNEYFEREHERIEAEAHKAFVDSLKENAHFTKTKVDKLENEWERQQRRYDITGATGGHAFEIHVKMPGDIVAHNATSVDDGECKWEFDGQAFRDRPFELMVTSRLTAETSK